MNDYEMMCKQLSRAKKYGCLVCGVQSEYACAYESVKKYMCDDKDRLYKLKGESKEINFGIYYSCMMAAFAMFISIGSFFISLFDWADTVLPQEVICYILLGGVGVMLIYMLVNIRRYLCVLQWGGIVQVAIMEIEEEIKKCN